MPRPWIVEFIFEVVIVPPPGPKAVEKDDKAALIEDVSESVETYPAVPSPATVDVIAVIFVPPAPKAVEKDEKD